MPMYDFECECGYASERMLAISGRDEPQECPKCKKMMKRTVGAPALHGESYQMKAILGDGTKVAGHFGGDGIPERWKRK